MILIKDTTLIDRNYVNENGKLIILPKAERTIAVAVPVASKIEYIDDNKVLVLQQKDFDTGVIEDCACMLRGIKDKYENEDVISGYLFYSCNGIKILGNRESKVEDVQMQSNQNSFWTVIKKVIGVK